MWAFEEGQRFARLDRFDPEGCLAEFDGEFILVDAVDTVLHDLAQGMLARTFVGTLAIRLDTDDFGGHAARRGQQKMSRAAGRVDDIEIQNGFLWICGMSRQQPVREQAPART